MVWWVTRSIPPGATGLCFLINIAHGVVGHQIDPKWCTHWIISLTMNSTTGCGMCYPTCRMVHVKDPLLLIEKNSPWSGSSRFPLSLSMIIYLTIYVWTISLNKTIILFCQIWSIIVNSPVNTAGNISKNLIYWNLWGQKKC